MSDHTVRAREPQTRNLTIAEMSNLYKVSLRTLRFYEEKGLLSPTRVGVNRLYSPKDRVKLQVILTGRKLGFSLREIDLMLQFHISKIQVEPDQMWVLPDANAIENQIATLSKRKADVETSIKELEAALAED